MTSHAFRRQLKPGSVAQYRARHDAIWPDLAAAITAAGIYDYSIFLDEESLALFAVLKLRDDHARASLPDDPIMRRWWDHMADLMEVHPDNRPVEYPLTPMFHLA